MAHNTGVAPDGYATGERPKRYACTREGGRMSLANDPNKEGLSFEEIKIALADALANKDWNLASELQTSIAVVLCDMAYSGEFLQYEPNALSFFDAVQRRVNCI